MVDFEAVAGSREKGNLREKDDQRKRGNGKGWVLGRGMVKGVTVGIHYLTVYCHSCGLRFCSGQEQQHLWYTSIYILHCVYMCSDMRYLQSETRLKNQTFPSVLFRLVSLRYVPRSKIHCSTNFIICILLHTSRFLYS